MTRRVHVNQKKEREAYGKIFSKTFVGSPVNSANTTQIMSGTNNVAAGYVPARKGSEVLKLESSASYRDGVKGSAAEPTPRTIDQ